MESSRAYGWLEVPVGELKVVHGSESPQNLQGNFLRLALRERVCTF